MEEIILDSLGNLECINPCSVWYVLSKEECINIKTLEKCDTICMPIARWMPRECFDYIVNVFKQEIDENIAYLKFNRREIADKVWIYNLFKHETDKTIWRVYVNERTKKVRSWRLTKEYLVNSSFPIYCGNDLYTIHKSNTVFTIRITDSDYNIVDRLDLPQNFTIDDKILTLSYMDIYRCVDGRYILTNNNDPNHSVYQTTNGMHFKLISQSRFCIFINYAYMVEIVPIENGEYIMRKTYF
jgi:hypothetical protein